MEDLIHNVIAKRFEVLHKGIRAELQYRMKGNLIFLMRTWVPDELAGKGIGARLAKAALDYARANALEIIVICPFLSAFLKRHQEYSDLKKGKISIHEMKYYTS